jgi:FkbM family methyltransferase
MYKCFLCNYNSNDNIESVNHLQKQHKYFIPEPKQRKFYKNSFNISIYNSHNLLVKSYTDNEHKDFIIRCIYKYNYYEPLISILFLKLLNDKDIFIDIGANIGYYSLICSKTCKQVYSFEPLKLNYDILNENIKINNINNIIVNNSAISNENNIKMNFTYGTSKICENGDINVDNISLDNYVNLNNITKIKLIKIDVEGYEIKVLETMIIILKNNMVDYIMCEVLQNTYNEVCEIFKQFGYNKIYDLGTGFVLNNYSLNETMMMEFDEILKNYELKIFNSSNTNLLFAK